LGTEARIHDWFFAGCVTLDRWLNSPIYILNLVIINTKLSSFTQ
jgi:hypothetical protein